MKRVSDTATTLFWIRHGEAGNNIELRFGGWSELPLTERGRRQADAVARVVAALAPTAVVSSDLARARETAAAIGRTTGLDVVDDPGLRERSLGAFDGLTFSDAQTRQPELYQRLLARDPDAVPDGGETVSTVFERVSRAIDAIVDAHPGGRVAVVSHGIALYHAFAHVCGLGSPPVAPRVFTLVDNASLSWVEHRVGPRWRIVAWNRIDHLTGID